VLEHHDTSGEETRSQSCLAPELVFSLAKHGILGRLASFDLELQRWAEASFSDEVGREVLSSSGRQETHLRLLRSQVLKGVEGERLPDPCLAGTTVEEAIRPLASDGRVKAAWEHLRALCGAQAEEHELYRRAVDVVKLKDAGDLDQLKKEFKDVTPGVRDPFGTWFNSLAGAFDELREALKQAQAERR